MERSVSPHCSLFTRLEIPRERETERKRARSKTKRKSEEGMGGGGAEGKAQPTVSYEHLRWRKVAQLESPPRACSRRAGVYTAKRSVDN